MTLVAGKPAPRDSSRRSANPIPARACKLAVRGIGFEPMIHEGADLKSAAVGRAWLSPQQRQRGRGISRRANLPAFQMVKQHPKVARASPTEIG